jgi:uncharacterized protein
MQTTVIQDDAKSRFYAVVDGHECVLDYTVANDVMTITHTGVPDAVGGRGIAGELMQSALAAARSANWKVIPACSYAAVYFKRHPGVADLLAQ